MEIHSYITLAVPLGGSCCYYTILHMKTRTLGHPLGQGYTDWVSRLQNPGSFSPTELRSSKGREGQGREKQGGEWRQQCRWWWEGQPTPAPGAAPSSLCPASPAGEEGDPGAFIAQSQSSMRNFKILLAAPTRTHR